MRITLNREQFDSIKEKCEKGEVVFDGFFMHHVITSLNVTPNSDDTFDVEYKTCPVMFTEDRTENLNPHYYSNYTQCPKCSGKEFKDTFMIGSEVIDGVEVIQKLSTQQKESIIRTCKQCGFMKNTIPNDSSV